jgi:deazaflavin-dependent oxidoreductase (nitroreductase family)
LTFLPKDLEIWLGLRVLGVHQAVYERSGGRIGADLGGRRMLLLTTRGRRTRSPRTVALLYVEDGDDLVVIGSKGGSDMPPAWFLNLEAEPSCTVQVGTRSFRALARVAAPPERARLWRKAVRAWPDYERYQARTRRRIPVVVLERR